MPWPKKGEKRSDYISRAVQTFKAEGDTRSMNGMLKKAYEMWKQKKAKERKEMTYSLDEIKEAWAVYVKRRVVRYLKGGKWETIDIENNVIPRLDSVRAESVELKQIMTFPEFLEKKWQKKTKK